MPVCTGELTFDNGDFYRAVPVPGGLPPRPPGAYVQPVYYVPLPGQGAVPQAGVAGAAAVPGAVPPPPPPGTYLPVGYYGPPPAQGAVPQAGMARAAGPMAMLHPPPRGYAWGPWYYFPAPSQDVVPQGAMGTPRSFAYRVPLTDAEMKEPFHVGTRGGWERVLSDHDMLSKAGYLTGESLGSLGFARGILEDLEARTQALLDDEAARRMEADTIPTSEIVGREIDDTKPIHFCPTTCICLGDRVLKSVEGALEILVKQEAVPDALAIENSWDELRIPDNDEGLSNEFF
ncbi:hypothetical protein AURDEDRAFT_155397 [Auricularia subglabra TFB-10046 SS5]|nr:hypothetical protein AURDEDRAFT_155397 [Auricularia subglabra TFB-10046 SS5]